MQAAEKIVNVEKNNLDDTPSVYTNIDDTTAFLSFYKDEEWGLRFHIYGFGSPKRRDFHIDFSYYLKLFLDLCEDFMVMEVKTKFF
jgi:hypothetical protein